MRQLSAVFLGILLAGALHFPAMGLFESQAMAGDHHMAGEAMPPSCPMGFVCPMTLDAVREDFSFPLPAVFSALIVLAAAAFAAVIVFFRNGYSPPLLVFSDTCPRNLRSVFKRE